MSYLLMGQVLAALEGFLAAPYRIHETALLIEIAGQDLPYQLIGISALLRGSLREMRFLLGREMDFHNPQSKGNLRAWQGNE
jgi:hypothetical protein